MSVEFNEFKYKKSETGGKKTTGFGKLVMKLSGGMIKTQAGANKIMLVLTLIIFAVTAYLLFVQF